MALINCYECGKEISDAAEACPSCGAPSHGTALRKACLKGYIEVTKQLLAAGADVNAKFDNGISPLHYAAVSGRKEVAELLIAEGADVNAKDHKGRTPLDLAIGTGWGQRHPETVDLLRKYGGKAGEELKAEAN